MSTLKDYEKILDFFYTHPDIPDDLRQRFESWMLDHENDGTLDSALHILWESKEMAVVNSQEFNPEALTRLLSEIGKSQADDTPSEKHFRMPQWLRYAAVIFTAVFASAITYLLTVSNPETETVLISAKGSTGEFRLPDGSLVLLNSDSRLTYRADDFKKRGNRKVAVDGEAYFEVVKDSDHPFVVAMGEMDVEVLGTSFDVRNYAFSNLEEVVLLSGKVQVNTDNDAGDSRILYPDQRLVLDRRTGKQIIEDVPALNYCRWTSPRLKLENEPLGDILITLSRKYCLDLEIASNVDKDFKLSLTISNETIDELMPVITYLSGINYTISGNTLRIMR